MTTMRALQVTEPGGPFAWIELPIPEPGPGEVLVRIEGVTTCPQWDLHLRHDSPMFVGHRFVYPYPAGQPGHEATGTIAALGAGVTGLPVGERVSAWRDAGHQRPGCYARFAVLSAEGVLSVPAEMPVQATAPLELAMCVAAAIQPLEERVAGQAVGVVGLGPAGLIAAQLLRAAGASSVIAIEPNAGRRAHAAPFVDAAFAPGEETDPVVGLIDCVGAKATVEAALDRAQRWVALFGVQREDYTFAIRHYGKTLFGYPGHSLAAARYARERLVDGRLDLAALVTHTLPLVRYAEGIDLLERQEAIKVCFLPWEE